MSMPYESFSIFINPDNNVHLNTIKLYFFPFTFTETVL